MTLDQAILAKVNTLPADKQQEVLDFVEFLTTKAASSRSRRRVKGLLADFKTEITAQDIAEARREMWANFPREVES